LIEEMVELYRYVAEDKGIGMAFELPERLYARADPNRIRQVIANLLDNAVKYTPGGGRVKIEACRKSDGAMISIQDTGGGIPPQDLPKIFDRLYRGDKNRSQRGLGLGLSLVRAVMRAHGGRCEVESHLGQGSQFTLFLPADPEVP
ncbi:MAG: sensor histidine kinase, partial [Candidatus Binatia bacterium]